MKTKFLGLVVIGAIVVSAAKNLRDGVNPDWALLVAVLVAGLGLIFAKDHTHSDGGPAK